MHFLAVKYVYLDKFVFFLFSAIHISTETSVGTTKITTTGIATSTG